MDHRKLAIAGTATAAVIAAIAFAGPLDPPAGSVQPTGVTVQQLSDAIAAITTGGGGCADSPTLPGVPVSSAQLFIDGQGPYPIDEWRLANAFVPSGAPGGGGTVAAEDYSFTRIYDETYVPLFARLFAGANIRDMEIIVLDANGTPRVSYVFRNVVLQAISTTQTRTCNGAIFAENVAFTPEIITVRDIQNNIETGWNFTTNLPT